LLFNNSRNGSGKDWRIKTNEYHLHITCWANIDNGDSIPREEIHVIIPKATALIVIEKNAIELKNGYDKNNDDNDGDYNESNENSRNDGNKNSAKIQPL